MNAEDIERIRDLVMDALPEEGNLREAIHTLVGFTHWLAYQQLDARVELDQVRSMFDEDALTAPARVRQLEQQLKQVDELVHRLTQERDAFKKELDQVRLQQLRLKIKDRASDRLLHHRSEEG